MIGLDEGETYRTSDDEVIWGHILKTMTNH